MFDISFKDFSHIVGGDKYDVDADIPELADFSNYDPELEEAVYNLGDGGTEGLQNIEDVED